MEAVVVAIITVIGAIIVALIEKGRRENKRDHGTVRDRLDLISSEIRHDIRQVRQDLSHHIHGPAHTEPVKPGKLPRKRSPKAG